MTSVAAFGSGSFGSVHLFRRSQASVAVDIPTMKEYSLLVQCSSGLKKEFNAIHFETVPRVDHELLKAFNFWEFELRQEISSKFIQSV